MTMSNPSDRKRPYTLADCAKDSATLEGQQAQQKTVELIHLLIKDVQSQRSTIFDDMPEQSP